MVAEIARFDEHDARAYRRCITKPSQCVTPRWPPAAPGQRFPPDHRRSTPHIHSLPRCGAGIFQPLMSVIKEVFRSEYVRVALRGSLQTVSFPGDIPLTGLGLINALVPSNYPTAGVVRGGTAMIARALETILEEHGGAVRANCDVREIIVESGKAVGVWLANGKIFEHARGSSPGSATRCCWTRSTRRYSRQTLLNQSAASHGEEIVLYAVHAAMRGPVRYKAAADNPDVNVAMDVSFGVNSLAVSFLSNTTTFAKSGYRT